MAAFLVCEGNRQGLDYRVLNALVVQFHQLPALIEPAGGGKSHGAVRAYLEGHTLHAVAIAIEDRDFRPQATANAAWASKAARSFIWRRHEIENYLLEPRVVLELFNEFRTAGKTWANSLPATEADTSVLMQTLAAPHLDDHAAQVLKNDLVGQLNVVGSLSFSPPTPAPGPGAHAPVQTQWLPALQQEATRLCQTSSTVAGLSDLQPGAITARYAALLARFHDPAFLTSGDYLIDLGGKQLLASLSRHLHGLHAPSGFSRTMLGSELLRVLEGIYQPNSLYQPDDFVELAAILKQY